VGGHSRNGKKESCSEGKGSESPSSKAKKHPKKKLASWRLCPGGRFQPKPKGANRLHSKPGGGALVFG